MTAGLRVTSSGVPWAMISPWCITITLTRQRHHRAHDVLDQQDGDAAPRVEIAQDLHHQVDLGRAQAGHHLVEQQEARAGGERARDLEPLALRQRQRRGGMAALGDEAEQVEHLVGQPARLADGAAGVERTDDHVVEHGEAGERLDQLEGAADPGAADLVRPPAVDAPAVEAHEPGVRPDRRPRSC